MSSGDYVCPECGLVYGRGECTAKCDPWSQTYNVTAHQQFERRPRWTFGYMRLLGLGATIEWRDGLQFVVIIGPLVFGYRAGPTK